MFPSYRCTDGTRYGWVVDTNGYSLVYVNWDDGTSEWIPETSITEIEEPEEEE